MSRSKPKPRDAKQAADAKLDEALKDTFPASDPVALTQPAPENPRDRPPDKERRKPATR